MSRVCVSGPADSARRGDRRSFAAAGRSSVRASGQAKISHRRSSARRRRSARARNARLAGRGSAGGFSNVTRVRTILLALLVALAYDEIAAGKKLMLRET